MNWLKPEDQLWNLKEVCHEYKNKNQLADWVLFAIERHLYTGRASVEFEKDFISLDKNQLLELIEFCLKRNKSDDGIIKSANRLFKSLRAQGKLHI